MDSNRSKKEYFILIGKLFLTFFKIGLFTFGGGYAMIPLIENQCVNKNNWITEEDMKVMVTVAESTPGPLAINSATFVGVKIAGFFGALVSTLGVVIPSFVIIFVISIFFNNFLSYQIIQNAFNGIKCAVAVLIIISAVSMIKKSQNDVVGIVLTVLTFLAAVIIDVFAFNFFSIYLIIIGGLIGLSMYFINKKKAAKI